MWEECIARKIETFNYIANQSGTSSKHGSSSRNRQCQRYVNNVSNTPLRRTVSCRGSAGVLTARLDFPFLPKATDGESEADTNTKLTTPARLRAPNPKTEPTLTARSKTGRNIGLKIAGTIQKVTCSRLKSEPNQFYQSCRRAHRRLLNANFRRNDTRGGILRCDVSFSELSLFMKATWLAAQYELYSIIMHSWLW